MPSRTLAAVLMLAGLTVPVTPADAGCTSTLPFADKRAGRYECTGVHPGMGLRVPSKKYGELICTAGFAFTDQQKNRYLTVPGTCHLDYDCLEDTVTDLLPPPLNELQLPTCIVSGESEEEPRYKRNAPVVHDLQGTRIGTIVYAVNKDQVDFAAIRLDRTVRLEPALPAYGGPSRLGAAGGLEEAYAFSAAYGLVGSPNARTGLLYELGPTSVYHHTEGFLSVARGTPVMKPDGTAVGYYGLGWALAFGWWVQPYGPALARAQKVAKLSLKLTTAPLK